MECPQNFEIQGLSSKSFFVGFETHHELKECFVSAIIQDLIDIFGDDLKMTIYENYRYKTLKIVLPYYKWLTEFAENISLFKSKCDNSKVGFDVLFVSHKLNDIHCHMMYIEVKKGIYNIKI
jgi:hypothetical protein